MSFEHIKAYDFRNFSALDFIPHPKLNLICGHNGSGKTSLLEALYWLGYGRSFRSRLLDRAIRHDASKMVVSAQWRTQEAVSIWLGLEKSLRTPQKARINGQDCQVISELFQQVPILLLNPDSYKILELGPQYRRQFLDWGVFHVEPAFFGAWKQARKILQQRNSALRERNFRNQISVWDNELVSVSLKLDELRRTYFACLVPVVTQIFLQLVEVEGLTIDYHAGWSEEEGLALVLQKALPRDLALGYTQYGPHRAEIKFKINNLSVLDVLSRGQQKLLIYAMRLAQGLVFQQHTLGSCVFLFDDIISELDVQRRRNIMHYLSEMSAQLFVTCIEEQEILPWLEGIPLNMFHVEHGNLKAV